MPAWILHQKTAYLKIQSDFEVVDGFTEFSEPASASLKINIAISILIGIAVAYLIVVFTAFNKYLANLT